MNIIKVDASTSSEYKLVKNIINISLISIVVSDFTFKNSCRKVIFIWKLK